MARVVAAAIVLLGILTACGSAGSHGFHSAAKTYSVQEVETAFSQHGLPLVKAQSQRLPGVTALSHGHGAQSLGVQVARNGGTLYATLWGNGARPHKAQNGNVLVLFPAADSGAVHLALAELH